jgi:hypothetical protein
MIGIDPVKTDIALNELSRLQRDRERHHQNYSSKHNLVSYGFCVELVRRVHMCAEHHLGMYCILANDEHH